MLTPIEERTIRDTFKNITAITNFRRSSSKVTLREPPAPPSSISSSSSGISSFSLRSILALVNSQRINPSSNATTTLSAPRVKMRAKDRSMPHSLSIMKNRKTTSRTRKAFLINGAKCLISVFLSSSGSFAAFVSSSPLRSITSGSSPEAIFNRRWTHWSRPMKIGIKNRLAIKLRMLPLLPRNTLINQNDPVPTT